MIRFKEEVLDGQSLTIVHYMISNSELWDNPAALEARGNVYDETGECVCACFRKFFNLNERPETRLESIKDRIVQIQEKRDGSLLAPVLSSLGRVVFKTKKSFSSDVALLANQCVTKEVLELSRIFLEMGYTPLFEFTHPDSKVVLDYGPIPQFTLLSARSFSSGEEMTYSELSGIAEQFLSPSLTVIPVVPYSWVEVKSLLETAKGIEGFVLILDDGTKVKVKTEEYLRLHRIHTEIRERDIAEAVVDETLDDIIGVITQSNLDRSLVDKIEANVIDELSTIQGEVETLVSSVSGLSFKEIALSVKDSSYFPLVMAKVRGKEPNVIEFWKKNYLKNYSLRCVFNPSF